MEIERKEKIEILLTMLKENNIQIIWLKDLDLKIVYYTVVLQFATITWLAATQNTQLLFVFRFFSFVTLVLSGLFLLRNHITHNRIRLNNRRMLNALGLFSKNRYGDESMLTYSSDWTFHAGRLIYLVILAISSIATIFASCYLLGV
jgi:hypothetical protein